MRACFFFAGLIWLVAHLAGCSTMPAGYGYAPTGHGYSQQGYAGRQMFHRPVPVPPSNAWFLNRPPMYCEQGSPLCLRIANNFRTEHARCWVDGRSAQTVAWGGSLTAWVRAEDGLKRVSLLPPGEEAYAMMDSGIHTLKCQRYAGPTQVLPDGSYVFEPMWEKRVSGFTVDACPTRGDFHEYRLEEGGWERITRRYADN